MEECKYKLYIEKKSLRYRAKLYKEKAGHAHKHTLQDNIPISVFTFKRYFSEK